MRERTQRHTAEPKKRQSNKYRIIMWTNDLYLLRLNKDDGTCRQ